MTSFEIVYLLAGPFLPTLHRKVRIKLRELASKQSSFQILDVGGRKSPYTIGVPAQITIMDLPRKTELQKELNLGITSDIVAQTYLRRSNIRQILIEDMTQTNLPDDYFDCAVAVEVLEHVKEDLLFVKQVHRVLKDGGVFLMTTPNADHPGRQGLIGPGNERFYTKAQLNSLLLTYFDSVEIEYAVPVGKWYTLALQSWSLHHPVRTAMSMLGSLITSIRDSRADVKKRAIGTRELIATAQK